jgi:hypothetical protein
VNLDLADKDLFPEQDILAQDLAYLDIVKPVASEDYYQNVAVVVVVDEEIVEDEVTAEMHGGYS